MANNVRKNKWPLVFFKTLLQTVIGGGGGGSDLPQYLQHKKDKPNNYQIINSDTL